MTTYRHTCHRCGTSGLTPTEYEEHITYNCGIDALDGLPAEQDAPGTVISGTQRDFDTVRERASEITNGIAEEHRSLHDRVARCNHEPTRESDVINNETTITDE